MKKYRVMIVGAGAGQVPLIESCKKFGLFTIVISPFGPYPGIDIADKHINEDIFNKDALVEIGRNEGIDFVISDQSDYAVPIVAYVASALKLPGNSLLAAETYTYKSNFRDFCQKHGIPAPKSKILDIEDIGSFSADDLNYPLIVKPADSQGSRGIQKIDCKSALSSAITDAGKYARNGKIVVEEFFDGREIVCEGFILDGVYHNVAFGDREYFEIENMFVPSKTMFPSTIDENIKDRIVENEKHIASLISPSFGIVHSEYIVDRDGRFIVVESALRGGGVYIASHLIPLSTGIRLTEALIHAMMGESEKCRQNLTATKKAASEYMCFYLREGTVTSISGIENVEQIRGITLAEIRNIHVDDKVGHFEHKGMRKGPFIITGKDSHEIRMIEKSIKEIYSVSINGKDGIVWN